LVEEYRDRVRINRYYVFFSFFFFTFFYRYASIISLLSVPFAAPFLIHSREFYFLRVTFERTSLREKNSFSSRRQNSRLHTPGSYPKASNSRDEKHTQVALYLKMYRVSSFSVRRPISPRSRVTFLTHLLASCAVSS